MSDVCSVSSQRYRQHRESLRALHVGDDGRWILLVDMDCVGGFINSASTDKFFPNTRYHGSRPAANVNLCKSKKYPGLFFFISADDIVAGAELFAAYSDDGQSALLFDDDEFMLDNSVTMSQAVQQEAAERKEDSDYEPSQ